MKVFRCRLIGLCDFAGCAITNIPVSRLVRAKVMMPEDHDKWGGRAGEVILTSAIHSINFKYKLIVTHNNIYNFND